MEPTFILSIPLSEPHRLYSGDDDEARELHRKLRVEWHPDRNKHPQAKEVFQHVNGLFDIRNRLLATNKWTGTGTQTLVLRDGKTLKLNYLRRRAFELGTLYIGKSSVCYVLDRAYDALFQQAILQMRTFEFPDDRLRREMERFLPKIKQVLDTDTGPAVILEKTPDVISARDLLNYFGGKIPVEHAAWILSSLHHLLSYFQIAGISHNGISLDTYFLSPQYHSGILLGGWWYTRPIGQAMTSLDAERAALWKSFATAKELTTKKASHQLDGESIRLLVRELLGDSTGALLLHDGSVPPDMARWIALPSGNRKPLDDYTKWVTVRDKVFPRKFVPLDIPDVYATVRP